MLAKTYTCFTIAALKRRSLGMAENGESNEITDFEGRFDPTTYLSQYYNKPGSPQNYYRDQRMKMVHEFFCELLPEDDRICGKEIKVLDYGSGPVIAFAISAAGKNEVSEIVLAGFTETNRDALHKWLSRDASAFDWSPYFKYVVQNLEKKPAVEVDIREEKLRSIVKVASCDIKANPPIQEGFEGPYDVIITFLSIGSGCYSEAEYFKLVEKLSRLVKPGGHILMFSKLAKTAQSITYNVGGQPFHYYATTEDTLLSSLKKAGFNSICCTRVAIRNAITGLSASEIAQLEAHPCTDDEFFYMLTTARKSS